MIEGYTWNQILLFFLIYCFLGWVFESTYVSLKERHMTNRGFLRGPVIPIYGFGAMMIVFATTPFRGNYLAEFIAGMLAATLFEYVVGMVMEAIFKIRYWDYSHKPFQLNGYICLESSLCWGVLSVIAAEVLQVRMEHLVLQLPQQLSIGLACSLTTIFCADTVVSVRDAWGVRNLVIALEKMKADLEQLQLEIEERSEEFILLMEDRLMAKKEELEQLSQERREELAQEIAQLRCAIEKEKQELELARAQLSARIERDVTVMQQKLEAEREEFYEKLQQLRREQEERKLRQTIRGNLLLQALASNEEQLNALLHKRGTILQRNPNAMSRKLGNLRNHAERQMQRRNMKNNQGHP